MHDAEYKGSFRYNDDLLNRIWDTGAYTVHLNMQEYLYTNTAVERQFGGTDWSCENMMSGTRTYSH